MVGLWEAIIDVVLPVFLPLLRPAGYAALGLLGDDASQALNGFVYFAHSPPLLRRHGDGATGGDFQSPFILDYMGTIVVLG